MSYEIKEILDYLKDFIEEDRLEQINLNRRFISSLLNYITNLQDDYSKAMNLIDKGVENSYKLLKDYKSRNDKALFYLANCDCNKKEFVELYDILQGDVKK